MDQQLLQQAGKLEQYTRELEEHDEFLTRQIAELAQFQSSMKSFTSSTETRMLAPLGKGVYCKTDLADRKLFVEVGAGVLVRKTPEALSEVIEDQLNKLKASQVQLTAQIGLCAQKLQEMMQELERQHQAEHKHYSE